MIDKIIIRKIAELKASPNNSRTHSPAQIKKIAKSIKEFGFLNPIITDGKDLIIAGHGRLLAALDAGLTEVPTISAEHLTEQQRRAFMIADNRIALDAGWDEEILKQELIDLKDFDFDISAIGFDDKEMDAFFAEEKKGLTDEDDVPETPIIPKTVLGDVWILGNHRLMCGDSTSIVAVEKLMAGQKADMVFTDPPYGMFLDTDYSKIKGSAKSIGFKGDKVGNKYDKIIGDGDDFNPLFITHINDFFGYCKEVFIFGADYFIDLLPNHGKDGCLLVWNKRSSDEQQKGIGNCFELFWSKQKHKKYVFSFEWFGFLSKDAPKEARNRVHPSMKPIGLIEKIWLWYKIKDGGIVYDGFGGSGSTLIACEKTNRHCRMMELDPKYCDVIVKRWQDFTGKQAVHAETGKTFDEMVSQ